MTKKLQLPPHISADAHKRLMAKWREQPDLLFETSVKVGVHNPDGTLTEEYGGEPKKKRAAVAT